MGNEFKCIADEEEKLSDVDLGLTNKETRANEKRTLLDCLAILLHMNYKLADAFPTLCQAYAIAVAIPVTSSTAERTFSFLKRAKAFFNKFLLGGGGANDEKGSNIR